MMSLIYLRRNTLVCKCPSAITALSGEDSGSLLVWQMFTDVSGCLGFGAAALWPCVTVDVRQRCGLRHIWRAPGISRHKVETLAHTQTQTHTDASVYTGGHHDNLVKDEACFDALQRP